MRELLVARNQGIESENGSTAGNSIPEHNSASNNWGHQLHSLPSPRNMHGIWESAEKGYFSINGKIVRDENAGENFDLVWETEWYSLLAEIDDVVFAPIAHGEIEVETDTGNEVLKSVKKSYLARVRELYLGHKKCEKDEVLVIPPGSNGNPVRRGDLTWRREEKPEAELSSADAESFGGNVSDKRKLKKEESSSFRFDPDDDTPIGADVLHKALVRKASKKKEPESEIHPFLDFVDVGEGEQILSEASSGAFEEEKSPEKSADAGPEKPLTKRAHSADGTTGTKGNANGSTWISPLTPSSLFYLDLANDAKKAADKLAASTVAASSSKKDSETSSRSSFGSFLSRQATVRAAQLPKSPRTPESEPTPTQIPRTTHICELNRSGVPPRFRWLYWITVVRLSEFENQGEDVEPVSDFIVDEIESQRRKAHELEMAKITKHPHFKPGVDKKPLPPPKYLLKQLFSETKDDEEVASEPQEPLSPGSRQTSFKNFYNRIRKVYDFVASEKKQVARSFSHENMKHLITDVQLSRIFSAHSKIQKNQCSFGSIKSKKLIFEFMAVAGYLLGDFVPFGSLCVDGLGTVAGFFLTVAPNNDKYQAMFLFLHFYRSKTWSEGGPITISRHRERLLKLMDTVKVVDKNNANQNSGAKEPNSPANVLIQSDFTADGTPRSVASASPVTTEEMKGEECDWVNVSTAGAGQDASSTGPSSAVQDCPVVAAAYNDDAPFKSPASKAAPALQQLDEAVEDGVPIQSSSRPSIIAPPPAFAPPPFYMRGSGGHSCGTPRASFTSSTRSMFGLSKPVTPVHSPKLISYLDYIAKGMYFGYAVESNAIPGGPAPPSARTSTTNKRAACGLKTKSGFASTKKSKAEKKKEMELQKERLESATRSFSNEFLEIALHIASVSFFVQEMPFHKVQEIFDFFFAIDDLSDAFALLFFGFVRASEPKLLELGSKIDTAGDLPSFFEALKESYRDESPGNEALKFAKAINLRRNDMLIQHEAGAISGSGHAIQEIMVTHDAPSVVKSAHDEKSSHRLFQPMFLQNGRKGGKPHVLCELNA